MAEPLDPGRPRALVVARRGKFYVGEPLFDRGPQVSLARGRVKVDPGGIALCRLDGRGGQPIAGCARAFATGSSRRPGGRSSDSSGTQARAAI